MRRVWIGEEEKRAMWREMQGNGGGPSGKWESPESSKGETTRNREYEADGYINSCPNPKEEMLSGLAIRH